MDKKLSELDSSQLELMQKSEEYIENLGEDKLNDIVNSFPLDDILKILSEQKDVEKKALNLKSVLFCNDTITSRFFENQFTFEKVDGKIIGNAELKIGEGGDLKVYPQATLNFKYEPDHMDALLYYYTVNIISLNDNKPTPISEVLLAKLIYSTNRVTPNMIIEVRESLIRLSNTLITVDINDWINAWTTTKTIISNDNRKNKAVRDKAKKSLELLQNDIIAETRLVHWNYRLRNTYKNYTAYTYICNLPSLFYNVTQRFNQVVTIQRATEKISRPNRPSISIKTYLDKIIKSKSNNQEIFIYDNVFSKSGATFARNHRHRYVDLVIKILDEYKKEGVIIDFKADYETDGLKYTKFKIVKNLK